MMLRDVVPGVHRLTVRLARIPYVNVFLISDPAGVVVVDTGPPQEIAVGRRRHPVPGQRPH